MGKRRKDREAMILNYDTQVDYYNRLKELALNVFKWENLPPTVDERFLEMTLYQFGYALFFEDEIIGKLALTCTIGGALDIYRIPILRWAYAQNGYYRMFTKENSVLIFNNYLHTPTDQTIWLYASRIADIQRSIDVNVRAQKTPIVIPTTRQQQLSHENAMQAYDGNVPVLYVDKELDPTNEIKVLKTEAPFVADKLQMLKNQLWNEALTFCGIENSNQDKKERLVANEVGSNYGNVEAQRNVMLNMRQIACEQINRMFGTNINVRFRSELETMLNKSNLPIEKQNMLEGEE